VSLVYIVRVDVGMSRMYNISHGVILSFKSLMFVLTSNSPFELVNDLCIPKVTLINNLVYASTLSD
jgi:hypothetical protein